ncbi:MAG TPA: GNAT family N-acetyltransferase [Actinomycetota bacterium]|nr:GNAT family N-acetyltransferase [Actinomycetota bacterium]
MVIATQRLRLEEVTPEEAERIRADPPLAGQQRPARWGPGFPLSGSRVAAGMLLTQIEQGTYREGFGVYEIVALRSERVVGDIGFHGPPDELGAVEIGYGVVAACRRQGVASEALRALSGWALHQPDVDVVHARTDFGNVASLGVLRRAGFTEEGEYRDERLFQLVVRNRE